MSHIISRKMAGNLLALLAAAIFFFSGQMARAETIRFEPQAMFAGSSWGIQTPQGTTVSWYNVDGTCYGLGQMARRKPVNFKCKYDVRALDHDRIALSIRYDLDGYRKTYADTLRIMPDGNLYNETAQAIAYRLGPDGMPVSSALRR